MTTACSIYMCMCQKKRILNMHFFLSKWKNQSFPNSVEWFLVNSELINNKD